MNICFINPTKKLRKGLINLIKGLINENEFKIFLLTPEKVKNPFKNNKNVELITFPSYFIPKLRYTIPIFFKQFSLLNKLIVKNNIDIIHCWSYFYPVIFIPFILAKIYSKPFIITIDSFPGINWSYGSSKLVDLASKVYTLTIGKFILKRITKVVLLGKYLVKSSKLIKLNNYVIIPLSVDINKFNILPQKKLKDEFKINKDEIILINIGRLVPVKGIEMLIKIHNYFIKKKKKIKTLIVGDGPYKNFYHRLARNIPNIIFTGYREDIPQLLSISDIFILTSISEGFPNVLLEASASGKAIITRNVGAASSIIINEKTGFIAKNFMDFIKKMKILLNNPHLRDILSHNAKKNVKKNYTIKLITNKYIKLYKNIIKKY
ncbi:MAG: glycosyltransferase family 4 protein [Promethearchaeota archaeon]